MSAHKEKFYLFYQKFYNSEVSVVKKAGGFEIVYYCDCHRYTFSLSRFGRRARFYITWIEGIMS